MTGKRAASVALVALLAAGTVGGCAEIERRTGLGTKAQVGTLGGAATGGTIAALAGAGPAWIAGSIILGALTGGFLGDYFDSADRREHAVSSYEALESKPQGGSTAWNNDASGNGGTTTIDRVYTRPDGTRCKDFTQHLQADGETHVVNGTACQQPDGTWKVEA